ncbi:AraC family transcriptional regulator [Tenacibaculum piscium]|uniref:Cupin n=2 Tax=Tenacibaculum piscium TaxID=1458515 RepID=A0A2H1YIY7_9FLAO|nr:AraC family transcriptional regulator [Tenacibaculum piscium]MBE7628643.1 helix-turn-helix domain-containing protein [Tenacibaculum piscium]MBE7669784.1 helix-turn-helix domain-containing protein [Tenacibaculum piscium]MBE7684628.1 helix-turn-helix domain-containing protein [Tenacibaculum piscium]MBE7689248.1 helix-turn-helix domain-containing protein [Tenacibaculum piscium]SOS75433.1 Cupin [Tenacibaculum piscium]
MKVLPFKIPKTKNLGLIYQQDEGTLFYDKFHQHEEIQLCYVVKGEGTLIVGDTVNEYQSNDILVIAGNQPHVFKSDASRIKESFMVSLFFTQKSFGETFFELDDFKQIATFFTVAKNSFRVKSHQKKLQKLFLKLPESRDLYKFIIFLKMIDIILKSETESLSSFVYEKKYTDNEGKRMRDIMDYTLKNYNKKIELDDIAGVANMTSNAFCRYFKQRTNKTFFTFLNELRIETACKLLQNKDYSIIEVSEKSGFKNISNFNRKFKELKGQTPSSYRLSF